MALVAKDAHPAQKVGGEWRFLKRAVAEWLRFGPSFFHEGRIFPPAWLLDRPFWEDVFEVVARQSLNNGPKPQRSSAKRGSKEAVLRHFGIFQGDADVEEQLARIRARREAAGE